MNTKYLIAGLILLIILCSCSEEIRIKSTNTGQNRIYINAKNPSGSEFPGGRGPDDLIIYTSAFGLQTGTNQYGLEAVVEKGRVKSVEGNNSPIPAKGFVISGHGKSLRWISEKLYPGIAVEVKNDSLHLFTDVESKLIYAQYFIKKASEKKADDSSALTDARFDSFKTVYNSALVGARAEEDNPNAEIFQDKAKNILQIAKDFYYASFISLRREARATWFRIKSGSATELEAEIRKIVDVGFNMICPETIYGGYAIYPGAHLDLPQHPEFSGWDPLKELVRLAKKYDLQLIPWVWVYHVGRKNSYLAKNKNDWLALSRQIEHPSQIERGYHFLCPSRKSVRKFWLEVYRNMIKNYNIDGLQLDYIRYPVSLPFEKGYCYCDTCRDKFQALGHQDPLKIDPENHPEEWSSWNNYRIGQISEFVADVRYLLDEMGSVVKLSADVFPVPEESKSSKMQDWASWLSMDYLDEVFTMSYTPDAETVRNDARLLAGILPESKKAYIGLGPYQKFKPEILLTEIEYVRESGVDGVCLFAFQALTEEQIEALKKGSFRYKASIH